MCQDVEFPSMKARLKHATINPTVQGKETTHQELFCFKSFDTQYSRF